LIRDTDKPRQILSPDAKRILLVEDEGLVRELARKILETRGYKVLEAMNGADALRILEDPRRVLDLVVTDIVMPDMGGRELVDRLKRNRPDLPVLFVSGYSEEGFHGNRGLRAGDHFLQKPFTPDGLVRMVREMLSLAGKKKESGNAKT
jgi:CheY-like chemotaxis protein